MNTTTYRPGGGAAARLVRVLSSTHAAIGALIIVIVGVAVILGYVTALPSYSYVPRYAPKIPDMGLYAAQVNARIKCMVNGGFDGADVDYLKKHCPPMPEWPQ